MERIQRTVVCPTCKGKSLYGPQNRYRPFCSERCRAIDLGAWASESYRIEAETPADADEPAGNGSGEAPARRGKRPSAS